MLPTRLMPLLLIPVLAGCYHPGEADYLSFEFPSFGDFAAEFRSGDQLLLGTRLCPEIAEVHHDDGEDQLLWEDAQREEFRACFDEAVSGPASLDADGCLAFEGIGEVTWELTPNSCGDRAERMRFLMVEPTPELQLGFDEWRLRSLQDPAFEANASGLAPGRSIAELQESPSEPRRIVAGQIDVPVMRFDNTNGRMYWMSEDVEFELVGEGIELLSYDGTTTFEGGDGGDFPLRMNTGSSGRVRATLPGGQVYESPELIAVTADAAVSLDLIAVAEYQYLFADVRDAEGHLIHSAPIEWSLDEGTMALTLGSLDNEGLTREYASYWHGRCEKPASAGPELRQAVVRARLGELEDTIEVEYLQATLDDYNMWGPSEGCLAANPPSDEPASNGCACTTDERAPTAPLVVAVGMLALLRRRRAPGRL
jgi:MYXO-CTERM domain-containing protein